MRAFTACLFIAMIAHAAPIHLRCDYLENPLGLDSAHPSFSWQSDSTERNWRQSAYQLMVATTPDHLRHPDVWDSGKRASADANGVVYGGPELKSSRRYYWTVRVWDSHGHASTAEPVWWETGLLAKSDWKAQWIGRNDPEHEADLAAMHWIWVPGETAVAPDTAAVFSFTLAVDQQPRDAAIYVLARQSFRLSVNGREIARKRGFAEFDRQDVTDLLKTGSNQVEITVTSPKSPDQPAGLAALVKLVDQDGAIRRIPSDARWLVRLEGQAQPAAEVGQPILAAAAFQAALPGPASLLRREFPISKSVTRARLYVTALGSYRVFLNGAPVGRDVLTPEFTDYRKRVIYQVYDVTSMLAHGQNAIAAILGDGWFGSGLVGDGRRFRFLPPPTRFLAQLEIEYSKGDAETIVTDGSWKTARSAILQSEIYAGETYDARLEQAGWDRPGFNDSRWMPAAVLDAPPSVISSEVTVPPRVVQTVAAKSVTPLPDGAYVFDLGQNLAGWAKLKVSGPAGTRVRMRFAEILNPDGSIYTENLRNANSTDIYVLSGHGEETYIPHFTFHGFRYVEVTGYPGVPPLDAISAEVISSMGPVTGTLTTSSEMVSRMYQIGIWGQRSNFISIPTDCPQRDERLGWTGDAEIFWRTGSYNADLAAFTRHFMRDMRDAQTPEGAFPNVAPSVVDPIGAPGWGDAGVILPWTAWVQYGDKGVVQENWEAMEKWMSFIAEENSDFIRKNRVGPNFGDWLAPDSQTPKDLMATAYWGLMARMLSQMAHAIDREPDAVRYSALYDNIRTAFQKEYVHDDGEVGSGSQTSYVLSLYADLLPEAVKAAAVERLVKDIEAHDWHLTTGFLGTPYLLFVLTANGRTDVAYRLLLNDTYPSWGYMLTKGATTWWERWNGDTGDPAMNSFNHYAFGSVIAWVYRIAAGIDTGMQPPGFRDIVIHPRPDARMTHARGEYESIYGKIVSDWTAAPDGIFSLDVTIPPNTSARVVLPNAQVTEDGKPVAVEKVLDGYAVRVGSGSYRFEVKQ